MVVYSIKDLEKLSGVKAHTLRIWEKRYGIINPKRTGTNIRYYLDDDLRHVLNIALLNKCGFKISKIAQMESEDIKKKVAEISEVDEKFENHLDALTLSLLEMDVYKFDKILDTNIDQQGFKHTMIEIIYPLLEKLSMMWMTSSINDAQEKFVTNFIKRKTIAAIDKLPIVKSNKPTVLIYLPLKEDHELSLLYLHYVIKEMGMSIVNLGINIPESTLKESKHILNPDYVFTIINNSLVDQKLLDYVDTLKRTFDESVVLLTGFQIIKQTVRPSKKLKIFNNLEEVISYLETIST